MLTARVADCNPWLVERIDAGRADCRRVAPGPEAGRLSAIPDPPAGASGNFVVSAGIRGSEWRVGLSADFAGMAKFFKALEPR
jgi:hypothetical protein